MELYDRHSAQLDDLLTALANTDPKKTRNILSAREDLQKFRRRTSFKDLKAKADAAVRASIAQAAAGFVAHFSAVAAQAADVTSTFKAATKLAKEGEKDLALNRINNFFERTIKNVEAGKEAVQALQDLGKIDTNNAGAAIEKIEAAAEAWKKLQKDLKA